MILNATLINNLKVNIKLSKQFMVRSLSTDFPARSDDSITVKKADLKKMLLQYHNNDQSSLDESLKKVFLSLAVSYSFSDNELLALLILLNHISDPIKKIDSFCFIIAPIQRSLITSSKLKKELAKTYKQLIKLANGEGYTTAFESLSFKREDILSKTKEVA